MTYSASAAAAADMAIPDIRRLAPVLDTLQSDDAIVEMQALMTQMFGLVDEMLASMAQSMGHLSAAERDLQQTQIQKQFEEVKKQIDAASKNKLLKIFMPLLAALGILFVAAMPIDPVSKGLLLTTMTLLFASSLQQSISNDSFLLDFFTKIVGGNESLANWLLLGLEAAVMVACVALSAGASVPALATKMAQWSSRVTDFAARVGGKAADAAAGMKSALSAFMDTLQGLGSAERTAFSETIKKSLGQLADKVRALTPSFKSLTDSPAWRQFAEKYLTAEMQKTLERFANYLVILAGVVTSGLTIDKAITDLRLAGITEDVQFLAAVEDLMSAHSEQLTDTLEHWQQFNSGLPESMDIFLRAYQSA